MVDCIQKPRNREDFWMDLAVLASLNSKDPNTKVGACLVSPDGRMFFVGWNGFPEGVEDSPEIWDNRDAQDTNLCKYDLVIHAERNALDNAHRAGVYPKNWMMFVTHLPCPRCVVDSIILPGIATVVYKNAHHMGLSKTSTLLSLAKPPVNLVTMESYKTCVIPSAHKG